MTVGIFLNCVFNPADKNSGQSVYFLIAVKMTTSAWMYIDVVRLSSSVFMVVELLFSAGN